MEEGNSLTVQRTAQLRRDLHRSLIAAGICRGAKPSDPSSNETPLVMMPCEISLFPYEISAPIYDELNRVSPLFNLLCDLCVRDVRWLLSAYSRIEKVDSFVQRFCDITRKVYCRPNNPKRIQDSLRGYITRSDYFLDENNELSGGSEIKQVEINLTSVVGIHVSQELSIIHDQIKGKRRSTENKPRSEFCSALIKMDQTFKRKYKCVDSNVSILYIAGKEEINFVEMMYVIEELRNSGLSVIQTDFDTIVNAYVNYPEAIRIVEEGDQRFLTIDRSYGFTDQLDATVLNNDTKQNDICKVSVIYFRTGYGPHQYPTDKFWEFRQLIEDSNCIVIPSAISQLAGLKKVQQLWCTDLDSISSKFCQSDLIQLKAYFADQVDLYDYLTDKKTNDMIHEAINHPKQFVLKPQREGGGNNYYDDEIPNLLKESIQELNDANESGLQVSSSSTSYILMRKIHPAYRQAVFFRRGEFEEVDQVISEIGIYCASLWDGNTEVLNKAIGVMARTKTTVNNEGGVSIGAAVYDSVIPVTPLM